MQLTEAASLPCIIVKTTKMLFSAPGGRQHPQLQQHTAVCLPNATLGCAPGSHAPHGQRRPEPLLSEHPTNFWPRSCDNVHYRSQQAALTPLFHRPPTPQHLQPPQHPLRTSRRFLWAPRPRASTAPTATGPARGAQLTCRPPLPPPPAGRTKRYGAAAAGYIAAGAQPLSRAAPSRTAAPPAARGPQHRPGASPRGSESHRG